MKNLMKCFSIISLLSLSVGMAYAVTCDNSTPCELPANNGSQASWTASASGMSGIESQNSVGPNGNQVGSRYYFAAIEGTSNPSTEAKGNITTTGDGVQVIGTFSTNSQQLFTSSVFGGVVQGILGSTGYTFYAQACPPGAALDSAECSIWASIGTKSSLPYPGTVFGPIQQPGDASINSIIVRTAVPAADVGNISQINIKIDNVNTPGQTQTLLPIGWAGNTAYTINDSLYTNGFVPNTKYDYEGTVTYPAGVNVPTGGNQIVSTFWTTPANPGAVTSANVTHCSAQITAQDSSPADPAYTPFQLCVTGTGGSCQTQAVGSGPVVLSFTNLQPGTLYTPQATAIVGNGSDATANGWNNSGTTSGTNFTTQPWGGSSSITNITTVSANFNFSGLSTSGVVSYQVILNGVGQGVVAGVPTSPIPLSGLTPDKAYTVALELAESNCTSPAILTQNFTTTAATPTAFALAVNSPTQLTASWGNGGNPGGITYQVTYCANDPTVSCGVNTTTTGLNLPLTGLTPETSYYADVVALTVGGGLNSNSSTIAEAFTPNQAPTLVSGPTVAVWTTSATLTVTATDNGGPSHLVFDWTVNPAAGNPVITSAAGTTVINGQNATNTTTLTFSAAGTFSGTVSVTDHDGTGLQILPVPTWSTNGASLVPTTVDPITPNPGAVVVNSGVSFSATIRDQFDQPMTSGLTGVTWSLSNGAASNTPLATSTFTFVTGANSTLSPTTLTVRLANGQSQSVQITVLASGPQFTTNPTITLNSGGKTANLSAAGMDSSPGAGTMSYNWTLESGPSAISVTPNNSTSANNAVVTFSKAGTYVIRCTITDNFASDFADTPSTTVVQALTSIKVCAANDMSCMQDITLQTLQNQQFTASGFDQFGNAMTLGSVSWTTNSNDGTVSGSGSTANFSGSTIGQGVLVTATDPVTGRKGSITVDLVSFDVSNAYAYPVPYKANTGTGVIHFTGLGSQASLHIYTTSGRRIFDISLTSNTYDWPIKNSSGESVASGVYFYVIQSSEGKKNGKLIIIQ